MRIRIYDPENQNIQHELQFDQDCKQTNIFLPGFLQYTVLIDGDYWGELFNELGSDEWYAVKRSHHGIQIVKGNLLYCLSNETPKSIIERSNAYASPEQALISHYPTVRKWSIVDEE